MAQISFRSRRGVVATLARFPNFALATARLLRGHAPVLPSPRAARFLLPYGYGSGFLGRKHTVKKAALAALLVVLPLAASANDKGPNQHRNAHETHLTGGQANAADKSFFGALHRQLGKLGHSLHGTLKRSAPGRCIRW